MQDFLKNILRVASSMKTGLTLLAILGIFSALGSSLLPDLFYRLRLFEILIILILINLGLCTGNRILKTKKLLLSRSGHILEQMRQWGLLILHCGIILILVGGIINASAGRSETVSIAEGQKAVIADDQAGAKISLLLNTFEIERYENGVPSQYYSKVVLLKQGTAQTEAVISVNHPLRYEGVKVYQQSYGNQVDAVVTANGQSREHKAYEGDILEVPGSSYRVKVFRYVPDFDPGHGMESKSMNPNNPRIIYAVYREDVLAGVGAAAFGEEIPLDETSKVVFKGLLPYSVFKVKEDPGLPYAATGGILFMVGVTLAELNIFRRKQQDQLPIL